MVTMVLVNLALMGIVIFTIHQILHFIILIFQVYMALHQLDL